jgi:hypothetical protein
LTGKWKLSTNTPNGAEELTADLSMETDGTLTGTVSSPQRGTGSVFSGYVSEDKFSFTINLPIDGNPADVSFTGTFEGNSMKGSISVLGYSFEFAGTKPGAAAGGAR